MKRLLLSVLCVAMGAFSAWADTGEKVTVNGSTVDKFVSRITFSGDNVVLNFDDGTSQTAEMGQVSIAFTFDSSADAIENLRNETANTALSGAVYDLMGRKVADNLSSATANSSLTKGIYIVNGKKIVIK